MRVRVSLCYLCLWIAIWMHHAEWDWIRVYTSQCACFVIRHQLSLLLRHDRILLFQAQADAFQCVEDILKNAKWTQTLDDPSKINANLWNKISEHLWTRWHLYIFLFVGFQPTLHYAWPSSKQNLWPVSARSRLTTKHLNTRPSAQKSNGPTWANTESDFWIGTP